MTTVHDNEGMYAADLVVVNTNHEFERCILPHVEQRDDPHCYVCGDEFGNGRHVPPYGGTD